MNYIKIQLKEENPNIFILVSEHTLMRVLRNSSIFGVKVNNLHLL